MATSLQTHLKGQLALLAEAPERTMAIGLLIDYIDERGYLSAPLETIAANSGVSYSAEQWEELLRIVQTFTPRGVGARSLRECLKLQLRGETPYLDLVRAVIDNHLEDVRHGRVALISQETGFDEKLVEQAIGVLKTLHPRPGVLGVRD
jgi:RNA polymerase sigma-54 factor